MLARPCEPSEVMHRSFAKKCGRRHRVTPQCVHNGGAGRRGAESWRSFRHSRPAVHVDIAYRVLNEWEFRRS